MRLSHNMQIMNTNSLKYLNELKSHYGTWAAVAQALGMEVRQVFHIRNNMSKSAAHRIKTKTYQLRLTRTFQHMINSGQLTRAQVRRAWVEANKLP